MTVSNQATVIQYGGTGANTALPTVFVFIDDTDIRVTQRIVTTGVETILTKGTHYTVTGGKDADGIPQTGTITPVDGATDFAATMTWTIERITPKTQSRVYVESDKFPAKSHEGGLDRLTLLGQEAATSRSDGTTVQDRSLNIPSTDPIATETTIPNSVNRASKVLSFDASGNPTATDPGTIVATPNDVSGSNVLATGTTTTRTLATRFAEVINVKDFGALGDDLTNDTAAIQAAIDAAEAKTFGASVFFPDGSYRISGVTIDSGKVELFGVGHTSVLKELDDIEATNNGMLYINTASTDRVRVRDMAFDGNIASITGAPTEDYECIRINRAVGGVELHGLLIQGAPRDGIATSSTVALGVELTLSVQIANCLVTDCGRRGINLFGVASGTTRSFVRDCSVNKCGQDGIALSGRTDNGASFASYVEISGNDVLLDTAPTRVHTGVSGTTGFCILLPMANATTGVNLNTHIVNNFCRSAKEAGIGAQSISSLVIRGNQIIAPGLEGIQIRPAQVLSGGRGLLIQDNLILNANGDVVAGTPAIEISSAIAGFTASQVSVLGNVVHDSGGDTAHGLTLDLTNLTINYMSIDDNLFEEVATNSINIVNAVTITELIIGSGNVFKKGQLYGESTLVAGTVAIVLAGIPNALDMRATACHTSQGGTAVGTLMAEYTAATSTLDINSYDAAAAVETNDTSLVVWRVLGTQDAFV